MSPVLHKDAGRVLFIESRSNMTAYTPSAPIISQSLIEPWLEACYLHATSEIIAEQLRTMHSELAE
jgi:hypothetical protein